MVVQLLGGLLPQGYPTCFNFWRVNLMTLAPLAEVKVATMGCRQSRAEGVQQIAQSEDPHSSGNLPCNLPGGPKTMKYYIVFWKIPLF